MTPRPITRTSIARATSAAARQGADVCLAAVVAIAMLLGLIALPEIAHAQDTVGEGPTLAASSHGVTGSEPFTALVAFEPGDQASGALSFVLRYDTVSLEAQSCSAPAPGICHITPNGVRLAMVNTSGLPANPQVLSVEFAAKAGAVTSELVVDVNTVANLDGIRFDAPGTSPGLVAIGSAPEIIVGGLNGEVLDADGVGVFAAHVCAVSTTGEEACTDTTGLGAFAIDGLESGDYLVQISDPAGDLGPATLTATVDAPEVTTGLSATLTVPEAPTNGDAIETDATTGVAADDGAPVAPDTDAADTDADTAGVAVPAQPLTAEAGEIVVRVVDPEGSSVLGANVCATVPVIGTQSCALTSADGVARLSDLAVSNYLLSADDPQFLFAPAETQFVGLNPGVGVVAELVLGDGDLGDPPEALAYALADGPRNRSVALVGSAAALVALTGGALVTRRRVLP